MEKESQVQDILKKLHIVYKTVQAHSKFIEEKCGLSSAKLWMLHGIAQNPGLKVSELAKNLSIHPSTCSNMLDKLEERQLISRDRSKTDQRSVHLFLTQQGTDLLIEAPKPVPKKLSNALEKFSSSQLNSLNKALENLFREW